MNNNKIEDLNIDNDCFEVFLSSFYRSIYLFNSRSIHHSRMNISTTLEINIWITAHCWLQRCIHIRFICWSYEQSYNSHWINQLNAKKKGKRKLIIRIDFISITNNISKLLLFSYLNIWFSIDKLNAKKYRIQEFCFIYLYYYFCFLCSCSIFCVKLCLRVEKRIKL